ncbi:MAG: serine hydrolase [Chthoniobacterales bacterium]|nr:serine hydrolase [Chthoniobacterales bacterium]
MGSACKLYILGELLRAVKAGERSLSDVVPLEARALSLPSGSLQKWPVGSPLTLHTLAG